LLRRSRQLDTDFYGLVIYVADLLTTQQGSRQLVTDLLRGNWCNGFWPLLFETIMHNFELFLAPA